MNTYLLSKINYEKEESIMDLNFRTLKAEEIEVRVGQVNKGGVSLMLYKDARCDMNILDEKVGPTNWQRKHSRENANCTVEIYDPDKKEWIGKEDTGEESNVAAAKGLASDSFKRACFNWGIGRELYSASDLRLFYPSGNLKSYSYDETKRKGSCNDSFRVSDIKYADKVISEITIDACLYGDVHHTMTFKNSKLKQTNSSSSAPVSNPSPAPAQAKPAAATQTQSQPSTPVAKPTANQRPAQNSQTSENKPKLFADDEMILIGNCKGLTYSAAKNTERFKSFLKWVKNATTTYNDPKQSEQYDKFKILANRVIVS